MVVASHESLDFSTPKEHEMADDGKPALSDMARSGTLLAAAALPV